MTSSNNASFSSSKMPLWAGLTAALLSSGAPQVASAAQQIGLPAGFTTITSSTQMPKMTGAVIGGNVVAVFVQSSTPDAKIKDAYEKLYARQVTLDRDMARILHSNLESMYEE
jgi:hypothetical protein